MPYLICDRCNGYYELQEGESEDDFQECACGGNLFYIDHIENIQPQQFQKSFSNGNGHPKGDNTEYLVDELDQDDDSPYLVGEEGEDYAHSSMNLKKLSFLVLFLLMIAIVGAASFNNFLPVKNNSTAVDKSLLGSNDNGHVNKYVYASTGSNSTERKRIAIVTGIHPREALSKAVWSDVLKNYPVPENVDLVQYDINVVNNPNDFAIGRNNGENLAATYILPDILKSKYDLIIVCHDHQPGYGEGFFLATPKMDDNSVKFTETLTQRLPFFNYYRSSGNEPAASNAKFTIPVASNGYRAIVYEMPGLNSYSEAYNRTSELLDVSIEII